MQSDFLFFLGVMVFFFVLWLAGGGPTNPISFSGPFITPVTGIGQTQVGYGDTDWYKGGINVTGSLPSVRSPEIRGSVQNIEYQLGYLQLESKRQALFSTPSPKRGTVTISGGNTSSTNPDQEYIMLQASSSNTDPVTISGWKLTSIATDKTATIPRGTKLPTAGTLNPSEDIMLYPGERAYVITGESPIGGSFAENMCTGYLEQNQDFYPSLGNRCPAPSDEFDKYFAGNPYKDNACYTLIRNTSSCVTPEERSRISANCLNLIDSRLTYNGCVASHRYNSYFYSDVWRIYLGRTEITRKNDSARKYGDLWKDSREAIKLLDENGLTVDLYTY
jgi:hypothetical protein